MGEVEEEAAPELGEEDVGEEPMEDEEVMDEAEPEPDAEVDDLEFPEDPAEEEEAAQEEEEEAAEEPQELKDRAAEKKRKAKPKKKMIEPLGDKYVVRMRQRLRDAESAADFVQEINELVEQCKSEEKALVFEDFDISQNLIPLEQFEDMCSELADACVRVERFRAFGCPMINDDAMSMLSGWLSGVPEENAPFEMHLSDCAIQTEGFSNLMKAFIENDAFPPLDPKKPEWGKLPIYVRLENNYIDPAVIEEHVQEGRIMKMKKTDRPSHDTEHLCRLLTREDGGYAQKEGEPPAPEDAPPPKRVHDKGKGKDGKGKGKKGKEERPWNGRSDYGRSDYGRSDYGKSDYSKNDYYWQDRDRGKGSKKGGKTTTSYAALPAKAPWERSSRESSRTESARQPAGSSKGSSHYDSRSSNSDRYSRSNNTSGSTKASERYSVYQRESDRGKPEPRSGSYGSERYNAFGRGSPAGERERRGPVGGSGSLPPPPPSSRQGRSSATNPPPPSRNSKRPAERSVYEQDAKRPRPASKENAAPTRPSSTSGATPSKQRSNGTPSAGKGKGKSTGGASDGLPHPWQKHYSKEYELHYFWNSETGESSWERPT